MKTPARLALLLVAGLTLAGCTSTTALNKPSAPAITTAREDEPENARDHFMMRDIEEKFDRQFGRDR